MGRSSRKLLVLDARSYTAAMANRAKGGGLEFPEYYSNCEIVYMGLANIHCIRKSFHSVRTLCSTPPELQKWLTQLESTGWLHNVASLLKAALVVVNVVHKEGRPVLVHCSDGWDRTPQIVALAEIMLDPFYRTLEGFQLLVEREWLDFGHKFADRCGHGPNATDQNERCPVFLQWLDCVYQLHNQFPCCFEFNQQYLVKLGRHTYSCLFGTFLCNNSRERGQGRIYERTFSVWSFLNCSPQFYNYLYTENDQVLFPSCHIRNMVFWTEMYMPSTVTPSSADVSVTVANSDEVDPAPATDMEKKTGQPLMRTKSCDNIYAPEHALGMRRQSSDPSLCEATDNSILSVEGKSSCTQADDEVPPPVEEEEGEEEEVAVLQVACHNGDMGLLIEEGLDASTDCHQIYQDTMAPASTLSKPDVTSIDSSTETLVNEKGSCIELERPCTTLLGSSTCEQVYTDSNGHCDEEELTHRTLGLHVANEATSTVSTSTTDISESSIKSCLSDTFHSAMPQLLASSDHPACIANWGILLSDVLPPLSNGTTQVHSTRSSSVGCSSLRSTPLHSRTPSSGFPATPNDDRLSESGGYSTRLVANSPSLDIDGLMVTHDRIQQRLQQIFETHQAEIEELRRDLNMIKQALSQQVYQSCNGASRKQLEHIINSAVEDCVGVKHPSGQDSSTLSDVSWEHIDEASVLTTLWVPDHAVSRCTGCDAEFWLGRRKHHCRNCGQIFCAQCSSQMVPVPNERLFRPVRVCVTCFEMLSSHCKQQTSASQEKVMKTVVATAST